MDINNVLYSFKYGRVVSESKNKLLYLAISISLLIPLISIIILILFSCNLFQFTEEILIGLIIANILSLTFFSIFLYFYFHNKKVIKYIKLCLKDAIKLEAFIERMDIIDPKYKPYQIQATFKINNKTINIKSTPTNSIIDVPKYLAKFDKKNIYILYSKAQNEVMIIKSN